MVELTIRILPDDVHRALRLRAARRGHSMVTEAREVMADAVAPSGRKRVGEASAAGSA